MSDDSFHKESEVATKGLSFQINVGIRMEKLAWPVTPLTSADLHAAWP